VWASRALDAEQRIDRVPAIADERERDRARGSSGTSMPLSVAHNPFFQCTVAMATSMTERISAGPTGRGILGDQLPQHGYSATRHAAVQRIASRERASASP
jgi:hypothetical protein